MQRSIILLSLLSPSYIASINEKLITIKNTSNKTVIICYKEHGNILVREKMHPRQKLQLYSATPFVGAVSSGYKPIKVIPTDPKPYLIIESSKSNGHDNFGMFEANIYRPKNKYE